MPALKKLLTGEGESYVTAAIIRTIGEHGTEDDADLLFPFLADRAPRVRANTAEAAWALS